MIEIISLLPGITLRACRDTRFKQGCLSFQLIRQMKAEEAALNALLPSVLLRGTVSCPDLKSITEHLDTLYGASVSPLVRRVGDYQATGLYCSFVEDRFAMDGDKILAPMMQFLGQLLLHPLLPQLLLLLLLLLHPQQHPLPPQLPQLPLRLARNEAAFQQSMLQQIGNPLCILLVSLASWHRLHVLCVDHHRW